MTTHAQIKAPDVQTGFNIMSARIVVIYIVEETCGPLLQSVNIRSYNIRDSNHVVVTC